MTSQTRPWNSSKNRSPTRVASHFLLICHITPRILRCRYQIVGGTNSKTKNWRCITGSLKKKISLTYVQPWRCAKTSTGTLAACLRNLMTSAWRITPSLSTFAIMAPTAHDGMTTCVAERALPMRVVSDHLFL